QPVYLAGPTTTLTSEAPEAAVIREIEPERSEISAKLEPTEMVRARIERDPAESSSEISNAASEKEPRTATPEAARGQKPRDSDRGKIREHERTRDDRDGERSREGQDSDRGDRTKKKDPKAKNGVAEREP